MIRSVPILRLINNMGPVTGIGESGCEELNPIHLDYCWQLYIQFERIEYELCPKRVRTARKRNIFSVSFAFKRAHFENFCPQVKQFASTLASRGGAKSVQFNRGW